MENNKICVDIVTDKKYFIEESINIYFRFNKKVSWLGNWVMLYNIIC